jgi:hypothetical protein
VVGRVGLVGVGFAERWEVPVAVVVDDGVGVETEVAGGRGEG